MIEAIAIISALLKLADSPLVRVISGVTGWLQKQREERETRDRDQDNRRHVVEEQALFLNVIDKMNTLVHSISAASAQMSFALGMQGSDTQALEMHVQNDLHALVSHARPLDDVSAADVRAASDYARKVQERFAEGLAAELGRLGEDTAKRISQVFVSPRALAEHSMGLRDQHGILVLPACVGVSDAAYETFMRDLGAVSNHYNAARTQFGSPIQDEASLSGRSAPPLLFSSDLLASGQNLSTSTVARIHEFLCWSPTICLQATRNPLDVTLEAWWWLRGGDTPLSYTCSLPLRSGTSTAEAVQVMTGGAQLLLLLLGDLLSVGGFEGVSVLTYALEHDTGGIEQGVFGPWYEQLTGLFDQHYGRLGLVGVPTIQKDAVVASPILTQVRIAVTLHRFIASPVGLAADGWLFQAVANPNDYPARLFVLAITGDSPTSARVRFWRARGSFTPTSAQPEDWLHLTRSGIAVFKSQSAEFAELCVGIQSLPERLLHT